MDCMTNADLDNALDAGEDVLRDPIMRLAAQADTREITVTSYHRPAIHVDGVLPVTGGFIKFGSAVEWPVWEADKAR